jgi:3-hydroxyisobutyrate dehydrogenase-like beta-hydroxyacid dehydrogenase
MADGKIPGPGIAACEDGRFVVRIGFIGFGEAARAFCDSLAAEGVAFSAYDILLDDAGRAEAMRAAMRERNVMIAEAPAGLRDADWIISAVTADQSLIAARSLLPHLVQGQVVIDLNSVSPGRKRETAAEVTAAGGTYLDMAVMAPVHPRGHRTPVLLAGEEAERLAGELAALGFNGRVVGERVGAATAIKMVRSVFVKGLEAITVEALLAAEASGCFEEIFASFSSSYPGLDLPKTAPYQFERTLRHGARRAAEMRESAATLDALGLSGGIAAETAAIQERMGRAGRSVDPDEVDLRELVRAVLAARLDATG